MKWKTIELNSVVWYKCQKYVVVAKEDYPEITLRRENDDTDIYISYGELMTDESYKAQRSCVKDNENEIKKVQLILETLTEDEQRYVEEKKQIILPIIILEKAKSGDLKSKISFIEHYSQFLKNDETVETLIKERLIERISSKEGISKRHIKRLFYNYKRAEKVGSGWGDEGLITSPKELRSHRKDEKPLVIHHPRLHDIVLDTLYIRLDDIYIPILKNAIEKEYLNLRRISDMQLYRNVMTLCTQKGIPPLCYTTVRHILKCIDPKVIASMRHGKKAAAKYNSVELGFTNEEAMYPLHIVEIDHKLLDVIVIDEETGCNLGRPWLTVGIDLFSRGIWCMYLSFEKLSANRVLKALAQGVLFKDTHGIAKNHWDICGKPTMIQLDNGKDFRSLQVRRAINVVLDSFVRFRPPGTPCYGGAIERFFRTLDTKLIHTLRGTTKGNIIEKGEYNAEGDAIITMKDLWVLLIKFVVDIYHIEGHKGLPIDCNTPALRYYEGLKNTGYPEVPEDIEKFAIELLFEDMKACTKEGIRHNNILYKSNELKSLISDGDKKYKIKFDVDDISHIYVGIPDSTEYAEVPAIKPPASSLKNKNLYIYEMGRKWLIKNGMIKKGQIPSAQQIEEAWAEIHEEIAKIYKKNQTVRKMMERAGMHIVPNYQLNRVKSKSEPSLLERIDEVIMNEEENE